MIWSTPHYDELTSLARTIIGKVELYNGSTLVQSFTGTDAVSSIVIDRAGAKKFFGYGICQTTEVKLIDKDRAINISKDEIIKTLFGVEVDYGQGNEIYYVTSAPTFYVYDVVRDENTNGLTVKAGDAIYRAKNHTLKELSLPTSYSIHQLATIIAEYLGLTIKYDNTGAEDLAFSFVYDTGANFEGTENLREVLDDIAEATQTIYFINSEQELVFKRLSITDANLEVSIGKDSYFTLTNNDAVKLTKIVKATALGNNISVTTGEEGKTQYVRDNAFWELLDDETMIQLLEYAIANVGGLTLHQFDCKWRGNYLLEPADKVDITTKDNDYFYALLLNDKITYNGGLTAHISWEYADNESETADNPVGIGAALNRTFATVDKVKQEIEIVAGETSAIKLTTNSIQASVSQLDNNMAQVISQVNTKATPEDITIEIEKAMSQGIESVTTKTGFTFNEHGLNVSKSGSEITTTISEDGMTVLRENNAVLTANNLGVQAEDLHATTFLIVGNNSRFEDYGNRTGCFYIGGN